MDDEPPSPLICVVDDDQAVSDALADLLASAGYRTAAFGSAEDFLQSPQLATYACVVSDVQLLGMSGLDLLSRLKARDASKPAILITARADSEWQDLAVAGGATAFLQKPLAGEAILACIERALDVGPDDT